MPTPAAPDRPDFAIAPSDAPPPTVGLSISDQDVVRHAFGPSWTSDAISDAATSRLGAIGRGVLQAELPELLNAAVTVRPGRMFTVDLADNLSAGKVRQAVAHLLENDPTVAQSMVALTVDAGSPREDVDDLIDEALEEPDTRMPSVGLLNQWRLARAGRLRTRHPGKFLLMPMEALAAVRWMEKNSSVTSVPYQQTGPFRWEWSRTALFELLLSAIPEGWPDLFAHVVACDPSAAVAALRLQLWPASFTPSIQHLAPLLSKPLPSAERAEVVTTMQRLASASVGQGVGGASDTPDDPKRRVPKKLRRF